MAVATICLSCFGQSLQAQSAPEPLSPPAIEVQIPESTVDTAERPEALADVQQQAITTNENGAAETPLPESALPDQLENADTSSTTPEETPPILAETVETDPITNATQRAFKFLADGGPSIWAIAALSVATVALILWKVWRLALIGAWSKGKARRALDAFEQGDAQSALTFVRARRGLRSRVVAAAIEARLTLPEDAAREETVRVAKRNLGEASSGLRALELIATIAPLLGLLGTVLGMIAAFQALQESGSQADPSQLAGGIWEALLTTAAGMAVAIPASAALTWFEAVLDRMRRDVEDAAARIFVYQRDRIETAQQLAAE
ncbi:MotA/TolQ/ExbB proton channel family protein [Shimia sp. R10_1]|nr:MotA/TolQ/ExbB proton channel family protein [Shimia sp. R10_1]